MSTYFKLIMIALLTVTVLTACGDGSDKLPKIISVTFLEEENRITVDATDDVKVTGYLITKLDGEPKLDDSTWRQSNVFNDIKGSGTFNVWVKDADSNLARSEIVIEDPIVALAKDYEFLQWHLDDAKTKIVDGASYDLVALKQQYGDLYRFIEPLSKEEVEYRFQYLAEYFAEQAEKGISEDNPGGTKTGTDKTETVIYNRTKQRYENLAKEVKPELSKFSDYYYFADKTSEYYYRKPNSLKINDSYDPSKLIDIIEIIPFADKELFVRDYMSSVDISLNSYSLAEEIPEFVISPKQ